MSGSHLPTVLVLRHTFSMITTHLATRFNLITYFPSNINTPLPLFVSNHSKSTRAIIVSTTIKVNNDMLSRLPDIGIVATTSAGTDHIDLEECRSRGVKVVNAPDFSTEDVADCAVGLLIDVTRGISSGDRFVRKVTLLEGSQEEFPLGFKLGGKRVGILGLGKIGTQIAKRLEAFNCIISYISRTKKPSVPYTYFSNIHDLASSNDVIILCCCLNNETYHIINKDVMVLLGKDGIIINVGRGALIDEKELVNCLMRGEIRGAGLDVFENEPNVPKELFEMDNVVLMPHKAAFTKEAIDNLAELIAANLEAFFANKPLHTPVL